MTRASRAVGRVWRVWVAFNLILSTLSFIVMPAIAGVPATPSPPLASSLLDHAPTLTNTGNVPDQSIVTTGLVHNEATSTSTGRGDVRDGDLVGWTFSPQAVEKTASVTFTVYLPLVLTGRRIEPTDVPYYSDFTLHKTADPSPVLTSSLLTYTLTISNTGNTTSTSIIITDAIPAETTFVSVGPGGTYDEGLNLVTWTLPSLTLSETASVTFTVQTANVAGLVVNESYGVTATNALTPTAGEPLTTAVLPGIVINEIMQNPHAVADSDGEWFELYNPTDADVDINGWTIRDDGSNSHVIDNGGPLVIPSIGYLVLGNNADFATNGGVEVDYEYPGSWYLGNSDDEVILENTAGHEIDRVEYDGGPTFPDPNGHSMALSDPALDNNNGANWYEETAVQYGDGDYGTPGWENGTFLPDTEPPQVVSTEPEDGETGVSVNTDVSATFNEAINTDTLTLTLAATDGPVTGSVSYDSGSYTATFDPDGALDYETTYTATIAAGLEDLTGNATADDYTWSFTTSVAGPTITPIHDIQYTEDPSGDSPYAGQTVTTEGVVVTVFGREVIIADPAGGAWSGLLIYADSDHGLVRGDTIRVTGEVIEYNNMTEIGNGPTIEPLSPVDPPAPLILATGDVSQEAYEAVLVQVHNVTVTDPDLGYGEWLVDDGSGGVRVDDKGSYSYVPQQDDQLDAVTGPVFYTYSNFKIEPRDDDDIVPHVPAPVLISEVQVRGSGGAYDEFIELYNPSPTEPFNLNGYRIRYQSSGGSINTRYTWSDDALIPPYGHYLLVNSNGYDGDVPGDAAYSAGIADNGAVAIERVSDEAVIDSVGWGDVDPATVTFVETSPAPRPASEQSIERRPGGEDGNGQDTNDNSADFQIIDPPNPQNTDSPPTPSIGPEIITIADARAKPDGTPVIVEGIATAPTGIYYAGSSNTKFYIQDETGGTQIYVRGDNGPLPEVTLGDRVRVGGLTGHYRNEFQIVPQDNTADITITDGEPEDVPPPREVTIADVGEGTEGWLIALEGLVVDAWATSYGYNVRLSDEQGHETRIYIDGMTGIDTTGIVVGLVQRFVGISTQYDDRYETKPRIQEDVPVWPSQQGPCPAPAEMAPGPLLISAVHYDTTYLGYDELAEAVQVMNTGDEAISLAGFYLSDNEASVVLPDLWLDPGQKVWLAREATRFALEFGFAPAWTYGGLAPDLLFDNAGDEALLLDAAGAVVDALVIEGGCAVEQSGWSDSAGVYPYLFTYYVQPDGQILYRKLDEATGRPVPDTDTAADWAQDPNDGVLGRKLLYPGWDLDQFFFPATATEDATTTLLVAPDNIYDGIVGLIAEAQTSIDIELYLFTHPVLADELIAAMDRGVHVRMLLEGEVYGAPDGTWDSTRWVAKQVYDHPNGKVYFWRDGEDDEGLALADRYNNVHQKFIIVDGVKAAVLSENLSQTSMPHDDKADGTAGNRGAGIITTAPTVVAHLQAVFCADFDPANHRDVDPFTPGRDDVRHEEGYEGEPLVRPDEKGNRTGYVPVRPEPLTLSDVMSFEVVQSPETSLRAADALLGMVARASGGDLVLVQQQYEHQNWGPDGTEFLNPRLNAYIEAARRGASVRIMVANNDNNTYEDELIQFLNDLAAAEGLDLVAGKGEPTAGWLDGEPEGGHIHNKMVLVYDGDTQGWVHVGSINGSENSSKYNREMALQIGSDEAFDYYAGVFHADWVASGLPAFLEAPVASFEVSTYTPRVGETVSFANTTTGSPPIFYEWNFGDGSSTSTERDPTHAYSTPGNYTVILTATNRWGMDTATATITVSGWSDICVPYRIEITGIGMGDRHHAINPQTLSLADPASVNRLLAQVAGRYAFDAPTPETVTFTTNAPQSVTLNEPSTDTPAGYTFEADLQPTDQITASVSNVGDSYKTPRGLILYAQRATVSEWTSVGKTTNDWAWAGSGDNAHTEVLTFPPLAAATDLFVTAVVIDNDDDARPMVVEATAGDVTESVTELGPTDGAGLNIVNLTLAQVPTQTNQVSVTLRSPRGNGDSLVLVGLNVSYPCPGPAPTLRGSVDMQGRPAKPAPPWAIPLTIWLTPARSGTLTRTFTTTTDQNGEFEIHLEGITPGLYDVRVKGNHTLRNLARNVSLVPGENHYFFGTLLEGDAETVDTFNQVLLADAGVLLHSFNKCQGDPGFVANADLDESGCVLLPDLGLLAGNYGKEGDIVISATTNLWLASLQVSDGNALIAFNAEEMATAVDEVVTLTLNVDPRGTPVNGVMVHLSFDPALVEVVDVTLADHLPFVLVKPWVDNQQGVVRFGAGMLGQTITEKFSIATLSLKVKAATPGTTITFADIFPATEISGPEGSVLAEMRGITLKTGVRGWADNTIYLPIIYRGAD